MRPDIRNERKIIGAIQVGAGEHHEERSGINAAVILCERNLFGGGHFAAAHFVQYLSGFGVLFRYLRPSLRFGEIIQYSLRKRRRHPQTFERCNYSVTSENGTEPRHSGVGIWPFGIAFDQHAKVGGRTVQPGVKTFAGSRDPAILEWGALERSAKRRKGRGERNRIGLIGIVLARDQPEKVFLGVCAKN